MLLFEEIVVHDTIIEDIYIDRRNPGESDIIHFNLLSQDGNKYELLFNDVYHAQFHLNFGVISEESVMNATIEINNHEIQEITDKWKRVGFAIDDLRCFIIGTNSTNSSIKIYAKNYVIKNKI